MNQFVCGTTKFGALFSRVTKLPSESPDDDSRKVGAKQTNKLGPKNTKHPCFLVSNSLIQLSNFEQKTLEN